MDLDNQELYFTKRHNGSITDRDVKEKIDHLKEYIIKDKKYINYSKLESDFDKFCYNHCLDIEYILNELEYQKQRKKG